MAAGASGDENTRRVGASQVRAGLASTSQVAELFEQHRAAIYAYLLRLTREGALAEELAQEVYLRALQKCGGLDEIENQRAWLFRVATNLCFSAIRRRRRFTWLPWEAVGGQGDDIAEQVTRRDAVERALARVPEHYRAPLLMFSHYGFSVREIAAVLETTEGAVKTRVYRAKLLFQQAYERDAQK